ncbi:hypothetical protein B1H58_20090 [Pantoea alhagi]|uniref:DUF2594 domain-containing protein n=1 Tax=Pantoea alhagi TaxID=1891675 RepID=A0A1W6BAL2_9GAMM|nr:DUF2594 family protein [Pantoea alhagi]ARJ44118.1 hypothetical protein B1H58_20090 [Pantoea alhagi]URQ62115.1 DUF2594 family protein [Pantoea alhagi]
MGYNDFNTSHEAEKLANEVACLKAMVTMMLKGMGQADAGKVIINMERLIAQLDDPKQAETFADTIGQIKAGYRR